MEEQTSILSTHHTKISSSTKMGNSSSKASSGQKSCSKIRNLCTSANNAAPPPYSNEVQTRQIKASDIPQWRWSNRQCREWLAAVLIEYGNLEKEEAERQARQFEGFGPRLFSTFFETWVKWFGANGSCIHNIIYEMFYEKGACPKGIRFSKKGDSKDGAQGGK